MMIEGALRRMVDEAESPGGCEAVRLPGIIGEIKVAGQQGPTRRGRCRTPIRFFHEDSNQ